MALDLTNISNVISDISKQDMYYIGNMKREKALKALAHHHFVLPECDETGNLLSSFVFVQFIGVKVETGFSHLLVCKTCNEESESLQQVLMRGNISNEFLESQKQKYCTHCRCITELNPESYYNLNENVFPWYFGNDLVDIECIQSKPPVMAVLADGHYGLVTLPVRAKKYRCVWPHKNSRVCSHVRVFETHEENVQENMNVQEEIIISQSKVSEYDFLKNIPEFDINGRVKVSPPQRSTKPPKLSWPLTKESIKRFRTLAKEGYGYEKLSELLPKPSPDPCIHGNNYDTGCPPKKFWVQSKNVKIYNTEYVPAQDRTAYYTPTVDKACDCRITWTGEDEMLLNISKSKKGSPVHTVSINLLLNYTWTFSKLGGSQIGFLAAHNNRMRYQYGAEQEELLPWFIWQNAVKLFWT